MRYLLVFVLISCTVCSYAQTPPQINVISNSNAYNGYVFLATMYPQEPQPNYAFVVNPAGETVLAKSLVPKIYEGYITDFKPQPGKRYSFFNNGDYMFYVLDKDFNVIDKVQPNCDCLADPHEFIITPDNHYFLMATDHRFVDMTDSVYNGFSSTNVTGIIIQELDSLKHVVFEWNTFDHFAIMDARNQRMAGASLDYAHCNSIDLDTDTSLLLSSRHLNEITRINRKTGEIIWRMGLNAVHNQFTFINDTLGFSYQHDARRLPNGHITLFDNGNHRAGPRYSRALEYEIDEVNKTATLVWEYRHVPDVVSDFMGNVQRLPNGNTLVGWGGTFPTATEVDSQNNVVMELTFPKDSGIFSYRVFKYQMDYLASNPAVQVQHTQFKLYPNPAKGEIQFQSESNSPVQLMVYNAAGQQVFEKAGVISQRISNLPAGIYNAIIFQNGKSTSQKFVME